MALFTALPIQFHAGVSCDSILAPYASIEHHASHSEVVPLNITPRSNSSSSMTDRANSFSSAHATPQEPAHRDNDFRMRTSGEDFDNRTALDSTAEGGMLGTGCSLQTQAEIFVRHLHRFLGHADVDVSRRVRAALRRAMARFFYSRRSVAHAQMRHLAIPLTTVLRCFLCLIAARA